MRGKWLCAALCLCAGPVAAQRPITSNGFTIDNHRGPVMGPSRSVGLGGAYAALVDGVDGVVFNPAGFAARSVGDLDWFSPDATLSLNFPQRNWDNAGGTGRDFADFSVVQFGLGLRFGQLGVGWLGTGQTFLLAARSGLERPMSVSFQIHRLGAAYQFARGEITVGVAARIGTLSMGWSADANGIVAARFLEYAGASPEFGVLWRPADRPFRVGVAWRPEVEAAASTPLVGEGPVREPAGCQPNRAGCFVVPETMALPWEIELNVAWMLGRRFNHPWDDPRDLRRTRRDEIAAARAQRARTHHAALAASSDPTTRTELLVRWDQDEPSRRAQEDAELATFDWRRRADARALLRDQRRRYLLLTAGVVLFGPVGRGQGIDAFMAQEERPSGRTTIASPRFGAEAEPLTHRARLRVGAYLEPSRFFDVQPRVHLTGGFDLRLFRWNAFKLTEPLDLKVSMTVDYSFNYLDWGISFGFWR